MIYFMIDLFILVLFNSLMIILMDEVLMSCWQKRIGPLNLGLIGMLSMFINGFNLINSILMVPNLHFNMKFFLFPFIYFVFSLFLFGFLLPFSNVSLYFSMFLFIIMGSLSIVFILLSGFSGCSKFCMLGCVSMIFQLMSFELILMCVMYFVFWAFFNFTCLFYVFE